MRLLYGSVVAVVLTAGHDLPIAEGFGFRCIAGSLTVGRRFEASVNADSTEVPLVRCGGHKAAFCEMK